MSFHVVPVKVYAWVFFALLVGLVLTVWVSYYDFGFFNIIIAMLIACAKAALVVLFFMHLYYSRGLTFVWAGAAVLFFIMMVGLTIGDFRTRGEPIPGWERITIPPK
ncbi:MAG: cytochrome C oxidase subunit IV family protein [Fimbriimonadales bacterium]|nr:cytochrome C oxidase subunit IV family protein [Fimbriimonadales bacterium]